MKVWGILTVLVLIVAVFVVLVGILPSESSGAVSPALNVIAHGEEMCVSERVGNTLLFGKDPFLRVTGLAEVGSVTVTSLPQCGKLTVGSVAVSAGDTVSAEYLPLFSYTSAASVAGEATFTFSVDGGSYEYLCRIRMREGDNTAPYIRATDYAVNVSTHAGLSASGTLPAADPDGDTLTYHIVTRPAHGLLTLTDAHTGAYCYTPEDGFDGKDAFEYAVSDPYGNWSPSREVCVEVNALRAAWEYRDISDDATLHAALTMAENDVMVGCSVGGEYYFDPDGSMSRLDFTVALLNTLGVSDVPDAKEVAFADSDKIPASLCGYVKTAYALGYVRGTTVAGKLYFYPDAPITYAEAAVMICRAVEIPAGDGDALAVFADAGEVQSWAETSLRAMVATGILCPVSGKLTPNAAMNRGESAVLLCNLLRFRKENL